MSDDDDYDEPTPAEHPHAVDFHDERAELQAPTRSLRRARLIRVAIAAALAATVFVVVLLSSGSGENPPPKPGSKRAISTEQTIGSLLAGIPESNNVLGKATAPITLRWFGDMECPFCKEYALGALPSIIEKWVRRGQLKIEYRSLETATREPKMFKSQEIAALAAGAQHKMWYFLETFYHEQGEEGSGYVTEKYLRGIARQISGLGLGLWVSDRHDPRFPAQLAEDVRLATIARLRSTPSFLISRAGYPVKRFVPGSLTNPAPFNKAIEYLLGARAPAIPRAVPAAASAEQMSKARV